MSKLTVNECKQIILKGRKQLTSAEHRIAELESLARDTWAAYMTCVGDSIGHRSSLKPWEADKEVSELAERMKELGLIEGDAK